MRVIFMDKKKKDYLSYTLFFQFTVCIILFGVLYGLGKVNSDIYISVKDEYYSNLEEKFDFLSDITASEKNDEESTTVTSAAVKKEDKNFAEKSKKSTKTSLSAEIKGSGGQDYKIDSISEVPANVSVNSYSLNQRMVAPVIGSVTSEFGVRNHPISNELRFHSGIDIAADMGTPIYAAFSGTVAEVKFDEWNGNYLKIKHDGDITTVYCHCQKLIVEKGQKVKAGEVVGYVGSTGSSTGPHLHFEFRIDNISYDPQNALDEAVSAV